MPKHSSSPTDLHRLTSAFDYRNRMTSSQNATTTSYTYDHTHERVTKTTGNTTTVYPNDLYARTTDGANATTTRQIYDNSGILLATIEGAGTATSTHFIHPDHLNSTNVVTDTSGTAIQTLDYYPYGAPRTDTTTGTFDSSREYIGEHYDEDTSLSYLNARYYRPTTGQFTSQDPMFWTLSSDLLADPQQQNSYAYARNNPINRSDPSGQKSIKQALNDLGKGLKRLSNALDSLLRSSHASAPLQTRVIAAESTTSSGSSLRFGSAPVNARPLTTRERNEQFAAVEETLIGKPYGPQNGPDVVDCSGAVIYGIRQTANPNFGDVTADTLYRKYSMPSNNAGKGTVTYYDYDGDGDMEHVTTSLGNGEVVNPRDEAHGVIRSSATGLVDYTEKGGGETHLMQLDWGKITQQ